MHHWKTILKSWIAILISMAILTGCSEPDQSTNTMNDNQRSELIDSDEDHKNNYEYNDFNEEEEDDEETVYRPGMITIDVSINQSMKILETDNAFVGDPRSTELNWNYTLEAHYTREALVTFDLSDPFITDEPDDEEKSAAYSDGPYSFGEYNKTPLPPGKVTGKTKYTHHLDYKRPNAASTVRLQTDTTGKGVIKGIKLENMRLSKIGLGYEYKLTIELEESFKQHVIDTDQKKGAVISDNEFENLEPTTFYVSPTPDAEAVERYPFREIEIQTNHKTRALAEVTRYKNIYNEKIKFIQADCVRSVETATKDQLTMTCKYTGKKWMAFVFDLNSSDRLPETEIIITINISAI